MPLQRFRRPTNSGDAPRIATYGSVFLLLLVSKGLDVVVPPVVARFGDWLLTGPTPILFGNVLVDPRLVGTILYAGFGVGILAVAYAVSPSVRDWWDDREWDERVTVGLGTGFVLLVGSYGLLGARDLPAYPEDLLVTVLTGGVAAALLAIGFARLNGFELRLSAPTAEGYPLLVATVLVSGAVAVLPMVALALTGRISPFLLGPGLGPGLGPSVSPAWLFTSVLLPGLLVGVGAALLFNGAIQEHLRDRVGRAESAAAVTALFGFQLWSSLATVHDQVATSATVLVAVAGLAVLAAAAAAVVARRLTPQLAGPEGVVAALAGVLVALTALGLPMAAGMGLGVTTAASVVSYTLVAAIACYGYERTRSVWVPALAFATYLVGVDLARVVAGVVVA